MKTRQSPAETYLAGARKRLAGIGADAPQLIALGEHIAESILAGGQLFTPRVAAYWPSEFNHRAGGLMGIKPGNYQPTSNKDVALFAVPRQWDEPATKELARLVESKARLFAIGRPEDIEDRAPVKRFAGFTGGAKPGDGLYGVENHRPLVSYWQLEQFVRGWITAGEFIAACTRAERMPALWMSVWLEGGLVRNSAFLKHHNLSEPWFAPMFHEDWYVPPLRAGYMAREFLAAAESIRTTLGAQSKQLATAGRWLADAKRGGRRIWTVCVGHSYPAILEIPKDCRDYATEVGPSFSNLTKAIPADLQRGDVVLHLGYAPVDVAHVKQILKRGLKLIHSSPYGPRAGQPEHENFLWLDVPWRPADATVDIPGYSVRALPMSSTAQTMALFAILSEMATRMKW
jgi:hypothetical protein